MRKEQHVFTKQQIITIFEACINKTLGDVDVNKVFLKAIEKPKITGIAGDVVEQSVLGYSANPSQEPDLIIDGIETELKTTGIKKKCDKKKNLNKKSTTNYVLNTHYGELLVANSNSEIDIYEAKEPMTITSNFWHKIEHLLFVFYLYDSEKTVPAIEYASFYIKGYELFEFPKQEISILQNDWQTVHDFIVSLKGDEKQYPRISHELRDKLLYIDTAPKYPNPPRFRLKRSVVTGIVQDYFGKHLETLPSEITKFSDIDKKCHELTVKYKGKTINEISNLLNIPRNQISKNIGEQIVVRMFNGNSSKMSKVSVFSKIGLVGKTIILTNCQKGTEDIKLFGIDFDDIRKEQLLFEDSTFYEFFAEHVFLFILFQEPGKEKNIPLGENIFLGFKRITFSENFIESGVSIV